MRGKWRNEANGGMRVKWRNEKKGGLCKWRNEGAKWRNEETILKKQIFHTRRGMAMVKSTQASGEPPAKQSMTRIEILFNLSSNNLYILQST